MTDPKPRDNLGRRTTLVLELADRPEGVTFRQATTACGVEAPEIISGRMGRLVNAGYLWRVKRHRATRFFSSPDAASDWNKANPQTSVEKALPAGQRGTPKHLARAPAGKPKPEGETITPDGIKYTVRNAPTFDARYQIDPAAHHFGAGFSHVGVGRDVQTGRPWGE